LVATCPINHIFWAHPTCHPKAHRLSKKCMNNLGARFGPPKIWAHDLGGTPQNLGARFGRDPQKFGRAIWAELWGGGPWGGWVVIWAPHSRFGHHIMMECIELCMDFMQTYINYEHLSYTAAYEHPKLQYRHDMHNCNIFRCAYQIDSYMCLSVHEYAYKVSKYGEQ
jgi:hypothetical protein